MSRIRLPEELLREIFLYILTYDEDTFCAFHGSPRWRNPTRYEQAPLIFKGRTNVLRVCKQWLRIATPVLYEQVLLWEPTGTKAVAQLVKTNRRVGEAIRYLRLEGGMGKDLHTIIKNAPNIHTIWITPHVRSSEGIAGLRKSLALMHPRKLYLEVGSSELNKPSREAERLILSYIAEKWTCLTSITLYKFTTFNSSLSRTLRDAPTLKELRIRSNFYFERWIEAGYFTTITDSKSLEVIRCYGIVGRQSSEELMRRCGMSERAINMFTWIETESDRRFAEMVAGMDDNLDSDSDSKSSDE